MENRGKTLAKAVHLPYYFLNRIIMIYTSWDIFGIATPLKFLT